MPGLPFEISSFLLNPTRNSLLTLPYGVKYNFLSCRMSGCPAAFRLKSIAQDLPGACPVWLFCSLPPICLLLPPGGEFR
jgi:hypothetical protein